MKPKQQVRVTAHTPNSSGIGHFEIGHEEYLELFAIIGRAFAEGYITKDGDVECYIEPQRSRIGVLRNKKRRKQ